MGPDMVSLEQVLSLTTCSTHCLTPNSKVRKKYHTTVIATVVEEESGFRNSDQQSDSAVTLRLADNTVTTIPRDQIEESVRASH